MKRPLAVFALAAALATLSACGKPDVDKTGLVKLSDHVYAMIATGPTASEGLGANSGFVVGRDGVLVIDTRYTPTLANMLLEAIRSVTKAPVKYVVNTHYHPDHAWGNMVFKAQGAVIMARPETRTALEKYSPAYLDFYRQRSAGTYEMLKDVKIVLPDTTVTDNEKIDLGGVTVVIRCLGPAHTAGDCVVLVPKGKIAFVGGLVSNGYHANMGDPGADYDNWVKTLDRLAEMRISYIVPGQGKVCGKEMLESEKNYITRIRNECEQDIRHMISMEDAAKTFVMPGAEGYLQPNILPFNVQAVYRHEVPLIVRPDFTFDLPADFQVMDGGGSPKLGFIRWDAAVKTAALEIDTQWKQTSSREVIVQDVADVVKRYVETGIREMDTAGSTRIDIGGEQAVAQYGTWKYKKDAGLSGSGTWTWALVIRGGKLYAIRLSTEGGVDAREDRVNMDNLEKIASTFRLTPRAS
ncbi:MAG: MBL fold metallo-hydrolase [Candidatus Krumholzibacteriaceae bacterium]|jgi:glyoxylase-like metal-dependent hydrolase (beta-lactamase superfamily II)